MARARSTRFGPADDPVKRAATIAALGHQPALAPDDADALSDAARSDPDGRVRAAALGALIRRATTARVTSAWRDAVADPDPRVRRRAGELAPDVVRRQPSSPPTTAIIALLDDGDVTVVEAAAWALGELPDRSKVAAAALSALAGSHPDALAREAAVAALGARGDEAGLPAIVEACRDIPAVRRRAVLALAPFTGPAVDAALAAALQDRDWQVRQAAEDLVGTPGPADDGPRRD